MKKIGQLFLLTLLVFPAKNVFSQESAKVKWYTIQEALKLNSQKPKKLFIDVYTDWCGWCKTMDRKTFSHPVITKILNRDYYPVKFNAEGNKPVIYKGREYTNKGQAQRSVHEFAAALLQNKLSYPSVVFMDGNSIPLTRLSGYLTPQQLEPILLFFGTDAYKTQNWKQYISTFKGEVTGE